MHGCARAMSRSARSDRQSMQLSEGGASSKLSDGRNVPRVFCVRRRPLRRHRPLNLEAPDRGRSPRPGSRSIRYPADQRGRNLRRRRDRDRPFPAAPRPRGSGTGRGLLHWAWSRWRRRKFLPTDHSCGISTRLIYQKSATRGIPYEVGIARSAKPRRCPSWGSTAA